MHSINRYAVILKRCHPNYVFNELIFSDNNFPGFILFKRQFMLYPEMINNKDKL